jgi:hypothetical protein
VIEWLLISFGRRPDVVKGAKQEWALIGATLKEFWKSYSDPKSPSHDALAALYRCYFFEAMRRDAFEEAYDVAKVLPERKELFAELAQWATFRYRLPFAPPSTHFSPTNCLIRDSSRHNDTPRIT